MSRISQSAGGKKNPLQIVLVKRLYGWDVAFEAGGGGGEQGYETNKADEIPGC